MSTLTQSPTTDAVATPGLDLNRAPVSFSRLVQIENRKLFNTRAAFWLTGTIVAISLLAVVVTSFTSSTPTFATMFGVATIPASLLMPVLAILLVTGEWSQRGALVTFNLEPRRSRVVLAKMTTCVASTLVILAFGFGLAAFGTALGGLLGNGVDSAWTISVALIVNNVVLIGFSMLMGFGFGMLLRNSPASIVGYFVLPTAWTLISFMVPWIAENAQKWLDVNYAMSVAFENDQWASGAELTHAATSGLLWIGLPIALGFWRLARAEVK